MKNKVAIIDLGTNTFHLLMAEINDQNFHIFHKEKVSVKIGEGGINEARITDEAMERAIKTIHNFKNKIDEAKVQDIKITATSAIRNAANREVILNRIERYTGVTVNILTGDDEAEYIFKGVKEALNLDENYNNTALIMDIGGGSVEFIICKSAEILWKKSYEIGAQKIMDKFHKNDPITDFEIKEINSFFERELSDLQSIMDRYQPDILIGSSGTFDTLSEIFRNKKNIEKSDNNELPLDLKGFFNIYNEVISKNRKERLAIEGMVAMRADMIVVACILIHFILCNHKFKEIRVSSYALKEGVLIGLL